MYACVCVCVCVCACVCVCVCGCVRARARVCVLTGAIPKGIILRKKSLMFVQVCFIQICVRTDFADYGKFVGLVTCVQNKQERD